MSVDFNPACTALLVIDCQNDFCHPDGNLYAKESERAIDGVNEAIEAARANDFDQVIFTQDTHNRNDDEFDQWGEHCIDGSWGHEFHEDLSGQPDRIVQKHTYDAFFETDLNKMLTINGIQTVFICGTLADVGVQETASSANLYGYDTYVLEYAVGYMDENHYSNALGHIDRVIGETASVDDI